ncbi:hypothetical protein LCGC14_2228930 [marine sediment metagenome]|uniref:Uncharacterized protein n=1 Tax=marine sediment metagenome TaxID=412755 RepID=A0A0F9FLD5_9ZZZZ
MGKPMRKLSIIFVSLLFAVNSYAITDEEIALISERAVAENSPVLLAMVSPANPSTPAIGAVTVAGADCTEDFNTANTADVAGNTNFDSEVDAGGKLSIVSNKMNYSADTQGQDSYVNETSCTANSDTELTIKFDIEFDTVLDVGSANDDCNVLSIYDDANTERQGFLRFLVDASGDIDGYQCIFDDDAGTEFTPEIATAGIAVDTEYAVIVYIKAGATGGISCKVGPWAESNTGFNDDASGKNGLGTERLGADNNDWGDGANDANLKWDNFEIWKSDQR